MTLLLCAGNLGFQMKVFISRLHYGVFHEHHAHYQVLKQLIRSQLQICMVLVHFHSLLWMMWAAMDQRVIY